MSKIGNMCNLIKDIIGYEGVYEINTNGIVYGKERKVKKWDGERLIKKAIKTQEISREGYARVSLFKNGVSKKYSVHRLVAIVFIDNKENKSDVNHKDGNKLNNNVNNLEWVSKSENVKHSINILKNKCGLKFYEKGKNWYKEKNLPAPASKKVLMFDKNNNLIKEFATVTDAGLFLNKHPAQISYYINKKRNNKFYNFKFKTNDAY